MIRAFFPERCQSWKRWPRWCFAIMLCGNEQLQRRQFPALRLRTAAPGLSNSELGDAERSSFRNRQSAIRNSISGWVATLAGDLHFFWRHFDFIRSHAGLAIGFDASDYAAYRPWRRLRGCVSWRELVCSRGAVLFQNA